MGTRSVMSIPNPESWYTLSGLLVKSLGSWRPGPLGFGRHGHLPQIAFKSQGQVGFQGIHPIVLKFICL